MGLSLEGIYSAFKMGVRWGGEGLWDSFTSLLAGTEYPVRLDLDITLVFFIFLSFFPFSFFFFLLSLVLTCFTSLICGEQG